MYMYKYVFREAMGTTTDKLTENIRNSQYDGAFSILYSDVPRQRERYVRLAEDYKKIYSGSAEYLFSSPGRCEIGGNHTDHQNGRAIAATVSRDIIACVGRSTLDTIRVKSEGYSENVIDITELDVIESEKFTSNALIRGICAEMKKRGYNIGGFCAVTVSDVPKGSGLSSSAAFEVLIATIINKCYNASKIPPIEIAKICRAAETGFFGKPCGLLDMTAISAGGEVFMDFEDPNEPRAERANFDFAQTGYSLYTVHTGANHAGLSADYASIPEECLAVCRVLSKEKLREVSREELISNIAKIRKAAGDRAFLRALHVINENERVKKQKAALECGDFETFLKLVSESGTSSYELLQNAYSISDPKEQSIPTALAIAKQILVSGGVCRVHGGGFAGTIQCYVPKEKESEFISKMSEVFGKNAVLKTEIRNIGAVCVDDIK